MTATEGRPAETGKPAIGFVGLGDQGLPMAVAIAEASYPLHVWARSPGSLDVLGDTPHMAHATTRELVVRTRRMSPAPSP